MPVSFSPPEVTEEILNRIANGEPMIRICGPDRAAGMPDRNTVHQRVRDDQEFRNAYRLAREAQVELLAEEMLEIADGRAASDDLGRDWLRVQTRRWAAAAMAPRSHGRQDVFRDELEDLEAQALSGQISEDELEARVAEIFAGPEMQQLAPEGLAPSSC